MTTRYRVEYALKTHRRDQLIEWIKGLLAVPFVLHSQPIAASEKDAEALNSMVHASQGRYAEIFRDVEHLIDNHILHQNCPTLGPSKLKYLVPSIGNFFTHLPLERAFRYQDANRCISSRRFVAPSFNDVRLILNSAQIMSLRESGPLKMITFDGDVTLYEDGHSLTQDNPVIARIMQLLAQDIKIGIVTAAGYNQPARYYERLHGLLDAILAAQEGNGLNEEKFPVVIVGGESNYLLSFDKTSDTLLKLVPKEEWMLPEMQAWTDKSIQDLLDLAEQTLQSCVNRLGLSAKILRKECAVGIIPACHPGARKFTREQLEETVLVTQQVLETSEAGRRLPFCAFNGGNDVFVDIGDKSWGVLACQRFMGGIPPHQTLHVGDQFLSAGANDFKARSACTTAWIANPAETVALLDEILELGKDG